VFQRKGAGLVTYLERGGRLARFELNVKGYGSAQAPAAAWTGYRKLISLGGDV
jgi:hypothetical protein